MVRLWFLLNLTPKAFANFSPGLEQQATTLGINANMQINPEESVGLFSLVATQQRLCDRWAVLFAPVVLRSKLPQPLFWAAKMRDLAAIFWFDALSLL